jgi:hypothetical protein
MPMIIAHVYAGCGSRLVLLPRFCHLPLGACLFSQSFFGLRAVPDPGVFCV